MNTKKVVNKYLEQSYGGTIEQMREENVARNGHHEPMPENFNEWLVRAQAKADAEYQRQSALDEAAIEKHRRVTAEIKRMKDGAHERWLAGGGSDAAFEAEWPQLHCELLRRRALGDE